MTAWLKTFRIGNEDSSLSSPEDVGPVADDATLFEPLSTNADDSPKVSVRTGLPIGRPHYAIGDLIAAYWDKSYEVRQLWRVVGEPEPSDDPNWSWQTRVQLVSKVDSGAGVSLDDLGIEPRLLGRRIKLRLDFEQEARLEHGFGH